MSKVVRSSKSRELAEKALDKKAALGEDIDLSRYSSTADEHSYLEKASELSTEDKAQLMNVGVTLDDASQRSGTFVQMDRSVVGREVPFFQDWVKHNSAEDVYWNGTAIKDLIIGEKKNLNIKMDSAK